MKFTDREMKIIYSLKKLKVLNRELICTLEGVEMGGVRNANRVLRGMVKKGILLEKNWNGMSVYHLSKKGATACEGKWYRTVRQIEHALMRNHAIISEGGDWKTEIQVSKGGVSLVADAVRLSDRKVMEVDCEQKMKVNREKVRKYKEMGLLNNLVFYCKYSSRVAEYERMGVKAYAGYTG